MKKLMYSLFLAGSLFVTKEANAQQGNVQLNAGIGLDSWKGLPVYVGADYFVTDEISVGGEASYASVNQYGDYKSKFSIFGIGANGNYHFDRLLALPEQWNVYAGLSLIYYNWSYSDNQINQFSSPSGVNLGGQVGARYFFTPNLGLNVQFGGGSNVSGGRLGITYKM